MSADFLSVKKKGVDRMEKFDVSDPNFSEVSHDTPADKEKSTVSALQKKQTFSQRSNISRLKDAPTVNMCDIEAVNYLQEYPS